MGMTMTTTLTPPDQALTAQWQPLDAVRFRSLMSTVAEPVVVVTGHDVDGTSTGLTVSSFASVSLRPPLVLVCVDHGSSSWARIAATGRFAVNVLDDRLDWLALRFATPGDRFTGVAQETSPEGVPVLADAISSFDCRIAAVHRAGDHEVVIGEVGSGVTRRTGRPLTAGHVRAALVGPRRWW
jgi:flavin reductase (DIM6/NTAB) family NADH-FMN oxidoreductase RutF